MPQNHSVYYSLTMRRRDISPSAVLSIGAATRRENNRLVFLDFARYLDWTISEALLKQYVFVPADGSHSRDLVGWPGVFSGNRRMDK